MIKRFASGAILLVAMACQLSKAEDQPAIELLLPGGTLYSIADRSYQSLGLPQGWNVAAGSYSPDGQSVALILLGSGIPPKPKPVSSRQKIKTPPPPPEGPVNKTVRPWEDSTRLIILNRRTGTVNRSWRLPVSSSTVLSDWAIAWKNSSGVSVTARDSSASSEKSALQFGFDLTRNAALKPQTSAAIPAPPSGAGACPQILTKTRFEEKELRFVREAAGCATPPEKSDFYRLVRENEHTHKDAILWEYRVSADTATCSAQYSCYTGDNVQFLSAADRLFLVWDGDVYSLTETDDGMDARLVTQLLPQFGRPWGIAADRTRLNALDIASKVGYQPVTPQLSMPHIDDPVLYAQNFCPTRSFNATVEVGPYEKSVMVPAGYQVGPEDVGSFKERAYTPLLISVTWTAFHHISDPVLCKEPYTVAPHTRGIAVSLTEGDHGALQCRIQSQEVQ